MSVSLKPEAKADLMQAFDWYERRRAGLGAEFLNSVDTAITRLSGNPLHHRRVRGVFRRALVHRFPYAIYYLHVGERVAIYAVLHQHRSPTAWQSRLTDG